MQTTQTLAMLDYDMIASTNWIPFMYVLNDVTEPTGSSPAERAAEATLSNIHIDYLKNRLNIDSTPYPVDNRSDYAELPEPRRPGDRPLHRRRDASRPAAQVAASTAARPASRPTRATTSGATRCST